MSLKYSYKLDLMCKKVFLRSNEAGPLIVGHIAAFETFANTTIPVIKNDKDHKLYQGGLVFPYSKAMERVLGVLDAKE